MKSKDIKDNTENSENDCFTLIGEEKNKSRFVYFAQQNLQDMAVDALMEVANNPLAMKMYLLIVKKMDGYNALVASYTFFMEYFNTSEASVKRAVKKLKDCGVLQVKQMGRNSSLYILNPEIVWKTNSANVQYCEFTAKVCLSKKEWSEGNEKEENPVA